MPFNEFGQIIKDSVKTVDKSPVEVLASLCQNALGQGNVPPSGVQLEDGVTLYYKPHHIEDIRIILEQIKTLSVANSITNLPSLGNSQSQSVDEVIKQIERNLAFSEKVNQK